MSLNKQQLEAVNQANFPDNNSKFITPELLREFNTDMIDAIQLTGSYATTGSNNFVGNQTITGNLNVSGVISASVLHVQYETASVIFSTGSNQLGDELTDIQTLSGSVKIQGQLLINGVPLSSGSATIDTGSLVTIASFNQYTQSTNLRLNSLETNSASVNVSISNLNQTTASLITSVNSLNQFSASQKTLNGTFATTGSNTFTGNQIIDRASKLYTNGIYWTDVTAGYNNLEIINQGGGNLDFASLNGGRMRVVNTPLILTGSTLSSNSDISTSANIYAANLTGSGVIPIGTISSSAQISALGFVSSSVTGSSLITASFSGNTLTFTKGDASTFGIVLPDVSGSTINTGSLVTTASFNSYTQSTDSRLNNIESTTASLNSSVSQLNASSASQQVSIDNLNSATSSYVTETESGSFLLTASFDNGTRNLTFTKGNNTTFAVNIPDVSGSAGNFVTTSSFNQYTASTDSSISQLNASSASQQVSIDNLNTTTASLLVETQNLELFSASALTSLSNLNNATASLFTSASLSLTTASFAGNTLTFRKGDGTTFGVVIPDVSGSTINTGSFATTGSNTFYGDQVISGSSSMTYGLDVTNGIKADYFYTDGQGIFTPTLYGATVGFGKLQIEALGGVNIRGHFTASLEEGYVWVGDSLNKSVLVSTSSFFVSGSGPTDISSLNAFTASQLNINTGYNTATQSLFTSASLAIVTASVNNDDITFTKGDGTQFTIQVATGSFALSSSYAESASYSQFAQDIYLNVKNVTGAQLNKGTVVRIVGSTGDNALVATASWTDDNNSANTLGLLYENIANDSFGKVITNGNLVGINTDPALGYTAGQILYLSSSGQYTNVKPDAPYHEVRLGQVLRVQQNNGSMYVYIQNGYELEELHDVDINTGSLANNDLLAYNSATLQWENKTAIQAGLATTGSNTFTGNQIISRSASIASLTLQGNETSLDLTASNSYIRQTGVLWFRNQSGSTGFRETNFVTRDNVIQFGADNGFYFGRTDGVDGVNTTGGGVEINTISGSLVLAPTGQSVLPSALLHLSSSSNTQNVNLIFKNNNNTADTIISGSNNIFLNPAGAPAGLKRYIGNNNIAIAAGFPTISGSMGFSPVVNNNYFVGGITMRGPVSASTWTITGNNILGSVLVGTSAVAHAQGLTSGLALTSNVIAGTLAIQANQTSFTGSQTAVSTNIIPGTVSLTLNQSAAQLALNVINDANFGLTNNYFSQSAGLGQVSVLRNNILGQSNSIIVTGSQPAGTTNAPFYGDNFIGGSSNILFADASTARVSGVNAYHSAGRNIIFGQGLIVSASSLSSDTTGLGSAFFGRFNSVTGNADMTAETVFAVGTGTSTSNRKTGFLIDSGSNTFVEGTLNVSGTLFLNGVSISGSGGGTINTASFATTGSNLFIGNQTITGSVSIKGDTTFTSVGNNTTNIILGANALGNATGANNSVAIGTNALLNTTSGANNFALGNNAMYSNTTGYQNVAMGVGALYNNTTGFLNVAIGNDAMISCGTASFQNVAIGSNALKTAIGNNNFGLGANALENNTGNANIALGQEAGRFHSGSSNVLVGQRAGQYLTGSANTIIGGYESTAGSVLNNNIIFADGVGNVRAQYSGSAWAFQDNIKFNKGSNKTTDIVTVNGSATINNSLVTADSIIIVTCQDRQNQADEYPPVVGNKTTGAFDIFTNVASNMQVAYLIINPT